MFWSFDCWLWTGKCRLGNFEHSFQLSVTHFFGGHFLDSSDSHHIVYLCLTFDINMVHMHIDLLFLKKFYQNESKFFSSFEWPMFQNHITQNLLLLRFFVKYIAIVHKEWTRTHVLISRLKFIKCQCFPHRNQSADLHSKSGGWFLYEGNTGT